MNPNFFVTGGTLARDTPCYVVRDADVDLYEAVSRGEYCYILTSRQMGKSSLMVKAASQLRSEGAAVAVLDLTAVGVHVTVDQWYDGLLARLGAQLDLDDELEKCWLDHSRLSPVQRWLTALEEGVLKHCAGRVVIFIDEIDVVRSLPFSADEFFASIRQCYNRRSDDCRWERLTICLLGVATPSELCRDPHITPFNIGRRIELSDFRLEEAFVLASGLGDASRANDVLRRVLYWTNGHPYLTQRLCREVAGAGDVRSARDVDRVCDQTFLSPSARERDDHLVFVRERMLRGSDDPTSMLDMYRRLYRKETIPTGDNALCEALGLTGITRSAGGRLEVRNRIYRRVFDLSWIRQNMPDAEQRRQRAAYYRGLYRAALIAAVMLLTLSAALGTAWHQRRSAEHSATTARISARFATRNAEAADKARQRAEQSRVESEQARREAEIARRETERALERERKTRLRAEQREEEANRLKDQEARLRALAEQREREAADLRIEERKQRELAQKRQAEAVDSWRRLQIAYENLRDARESSAARAALFTQVPEWLQQYYAEAVSQFARRQAANGQVLDALKTYVDACDLALQGEGFWLNELVHIEPHVLAHARVDPEPFNVHIRVSPREIFDKILKPAIVLGERELPKQTPGERNETSEKNETSHLLASLYGFRGRVIFQRRGEDWIPPDGLKLVVASYDRAIELRSGHYEFHVGRAVARFWIPGQRQLLLIARDLQFALEHYPARVAADGGDLDDAARRDLILLHSSLGGVQEMMADEATDRNARRKLVHAAWSDYTRVHQLDDKQTKNVVALGRTLRKQAMLAVDPERTQLLTKAQATIQSALAVESDYAQGYNELGECSLLKGNVRQAREDFDRAVTHGETNDRVENLYRYLCNQANAWCRSAATAEELHKATDAADRAIALNLDASADAQFYKGLSLWSLARLESSETGQRQQLRKALATFDTALSEVPNHFGSLISRCQLVFESEGLGLSDPQLRRAGEDAQRAIRLATGSEQAAKACYVAGLGRLREHIASQSEPALVACLELALKAAGLSKEYVSKSADFFRHAERRTWRSAALQTRASTLVEDFRKL